MVVLNGMEVNCGKFVRVRLDYAPKRSLRLHTSGSKNAFTQGNILSIVLPWKVSSYKDCVQLKIVFHLRLLSIEKCSPTNIVFQWKLSSKKLSSSHNCLPPKISIDNYHPTKIVFLWKVSSTKDCHTLKSVFLQSSSSNEGHFLL